MTVQSLSGLGRARVALYSHDAQGLGHVRRNLAIAGALARIRPAPDVLVLTGAPEASALTRPPGCDIVGLPGMAKDEGGRYRSRHLSVPVGELVRLRSATIDAALRAFDPDLLIVDRHPWGFGRELVPILETLAERSRVVLGLRDVLDEPGRARHEWARDHASEAIERWYDQIWYYGDPRVHDATADLGLPDRLAGMVVPTGYLARGRHRRPHEVPPRPVGGPFVLGLVGGGADGWALARAFATAPMPVGHVGVLVTGPRMPHHRQAELRAIVRTRPELRVFEFVDEVESWVEGADAVVSMGGYNTVCEVIAAGPPLLVVPRVRPRTEQLVRAERLAAAGLLDVLHPDHLDPAALGGWLAGAAGPDGGRSAVRRPASTVDLDGLERIPALALPLIESAPARREEPGHVA
ncbi:glycosyltransferase family protein [Jiangella sp. DSM 45060]|uniref:glycosyltransferase family protein n=1 Tax=Jiangella sp. DSM 45060 TaxID=1798224 RepID=UPI0008796B06|nr:glycosyltransferase [Jiangella sp. DSM 45060]SDT55996.1 Predicted glycosyl transferase [Jiangella sp. DSM 45060]